MAKIISFIFRIVLGVIFLFAGLAKISDPVRFIITIREFRLFPETIVPFTAVFLPWLEFLLGLFLILGLFYRSSSLLLAFVNMIFTFAILSVIVRGFEISCGCFGLFADIMKLPDRADLTAIIRNIIFISMCLYIFFVKTTVISVENYINEWNK